MERKWVHLLFAMGGLVLLFLCVKSGDWIWSYFGKSKPLILYSASFVIAATAVWLTWRNETIFTLASECVTELLKVTWPSRRDTMMATLVVVVTVMIASIFLSLFDGVWSYVTRMIYG